MGEQGQRPGRHRHGRVDEPHDTLKLWQRPVWQLRHPTPGRHHLASGRALAALATPGEATSRALRAIPAQRGSS